MAQLVSAPVLTSALAKLGYSGHLGFEPQLELSYICSRLGWPAAGGSGRTEGQLTSVSGEDRVRLCGHVKLSLLNPAEYPEFPDRTVGVRTCATSFA